MKSLGDAIQMFGFVISSFAMIFIIFLVHFSLLFRAGPQDFVKGDPIQLKVQNLTSEKTEDSYFYYSLPYCLPKIVVDHANQGEIIHKNMIESSPYKFKMLEPQLCNVVCRTTLSGKDAKEFKEKIDVEYRVNMILDNLRLVNPYNNTNMSSLVYQKGFPVGVKILYAGEMEHKYFINNHLTFTLKYQKDERTDAARIVKFEVKPLSVKHEYEGEWNDKIRLTNCGPHAKYFVTGNDSPQEVEDEKEIIFTYDVEFQESEIIWASRWGDFVCTVDSRNIHWSSIILSFLLCFFLLGIIILSTEPILPKNIYRPDPLKTQEEGEAGTKEKIGWVVVRGDVFRPPTNSDLLCVFAGTGVQCFGMILVTMFAAALGFISPSNRKGLMTKLLFLWVFMGIFAGYTSASLCKMFQATRWKKISLITSFPGIVFIIFFILSAPSWEESWGAVPFGTMFALVLKWLGIFISLVFVGSYVGFENPAIKNPLNAHGIPREIPKQTWFMNPLFTILIGGIFPFGVVSIELFFIITSIGLSQFYCILGFLFLVFFFLVVICAEVPIIFCYFQLCREDYLWWWRSFLTSASSGLYLFFYVAFYFTKMNGTKPVSSFLYFGSALIGSFALFVLTGTIGLFACFSFTRDVYSCFKID